MSKKKFKCGGCHKMFKRERDANSCFSTHMNETDSVLNQGANMNHVCDCGNTFSDVNGMEACQKSNHSVVKEVTMTREEIIKLAESNGLSVKEKKVLSYQAVKIGGATVHLLPGVLLYRVMKDKSIGPNNLNGLVLGVAPTRSQGNWTMAGVVVEIPSEFGVIRLYGKVGNKILEGDISGVQMDRQSMNAVINGKEFSETVAKAWKEAYGDLKNVDFTMKPARVKARVCILGWKSKYEGNVFMAIGRDSDARLMARDIRAKRTENSAIFTPPEAESNGMELKEDDFFGEDQGAEDNLNS